MIFEGFLKKATIHSIINKSNAFFFCTAVQQSFCLIEKATCTKHGVLTRGDIWLEDSQIFLDRVFGVI